MRNERDDTTDVLVTKKTLKKVLENTVVITLEISMLGVVQQTQDLEQPLLPAWFSGKVAGEESLAIGDAKYACEIRDYEVKAGRGRAWYCPTLMAVLKQEEKSSTGSITIATVAVGETVTVKETDFLCLVTESTVETVVQGKKVSSQSKTWSSRDIPGGLVKSETTAEVDGQEVIQKIVVTDFSIPTE